MLSHILRITALGCVLFSPVSGADKQLEPVRGSNDQVELTASIHIGRQAVKPLLGIDPTYDVIVVDLKLRPRGDAVVPVSRDDFTLISRKDGQKTQALHPSQIAGSSALVVASTGPGAAGGMLGGRRGPIWGGVPGTGDRPRRVGGDDDTMVGSVSEGRTETSIQEDKANAENPLLAAMKGKELPLEKTNEPAAGLLYFLLEGKHKPKDLELIYKGSGGTVILDFVK